MSLSQKLIPIKKYLTEPRHRFAVNTKLGINNIISDKRYLKKMFKYRLGYEPDFDHPKTFNEKLQWIKLYDRQPIYTTMVDKYLVKDYVAGIIGAEYVIPNLGVWDRFDDIDFDALPEQFVLKVTHDSGGLVICKDKSKLDKAAAKKKIEKSLKSKYFYYGREWPYKNVKPRIIAEQYVSGADGGDVADYKIHCSYGKPQFTLVCADRFADTGFTQDFYSKDWEHYDVKRFTSKNAIKPQERPAQLDLMYELASKLSQNIPFVRVDFYIVEDKLYFGELTFFPANGFGPFSPKKYDRIFGDMITLPIEK